MNHTLPYAVNCSLLFTERPLLQRPAAAKAAGFDAVEFWWPFDEAVPGDAEVAVFEAAVRDAGVALVGLNFAAGDIAGGDRGLVSWPGRSEELRDNVEVTVGIGERLGCRAFNALYGNRIEGVEPAAQDDLAAENLAFAAEAAAAIGATVLVEPVSGAPRYPLLSAADLYHLSVNGDDVDKVIEAYAERVAHVQVADAPGRNEPGTGTLPIDRYLRSLEDTGYRGWVALEYKPSGSTLDSLAWLPAERRGAGR